MLLKKRNNSSILENPIIPSVLIALWAFFATLWNLGMSLVMFGILFWAIVNFIANPKLFLRFKKNKTILIPLGIWLTLLITGLAHGNLTQGTNELKTLIPFAFAPLFFLAFPKLHLRIIWFGVILGTFLSLAISDIYGLLHYPLPDPRNASIFISHIRLSLFGALALYLLLQSEFRFKKIAVALFTITFVSFLLLTATISGWFFIAVVACVHLLAKFKKLITVSLVGMVCIVAFSAFYFYNKTNACVSSGNTLVKTENGRDYDFAEPTHQTENGYFVFQNINQSEVQTAWINRTNSDYNEKDARNQTVYNTLIRFLTSKNLTKDSLGVWSLTNEDIQHIKLGFTNVNEPHRTPLDKRYHQLLYEFQVYLDHGNASGHSLFQRLDYYNAAWHIIQNSFLTGVGIGNVKDTYHNTYMAIHSKLDAAHQHQVHNQFLSYLISGGILAFILFLWYFGASWKEMRLNGLFEASVGKVFIALAFASCLSEDTLTTQQGVAFFAVFTAILFTRNN